MFDVITENSFDFRSDEYAALFQRSCATAFQHPLWLERLYGRLAPEVGATPLVIAVRSRADGTLAMLLPLVRRRYGVMRVVEVADLRVSDYAAPVGDDRSLTAVLGDERACRDIRRAMKPYDLLRLRKLGNAAPTLARLFEARRPSPMEMSAHLAPLYAPYSQWRADAVDPSYQKELAKKRRKLQRRGDLRLECLHEPARIEAGLRTMQAYRQFRFHDRGEDDLLQKPVYFDFYLDMAVAGASTGLSRMYSLFLDGTPIAVVWGLAHRQRFLVLLAGFDLAGYKNKSIGSITFEDIARDCIERGDTGLDFTIGDESYKRLFGAQPQTMWMISRAGSPLGALADFVTTNVPWTTSLAKRLTRRDAAPSPA